MPIACIAQANTSADIARGYLLFDRVRSALAAALVMPFDTLVSVEFDGLVRNRVRIATMDLRPPNRGIANALPQPP
jgi:hypothetical protein